MLRMICSSESTYGRWKDESRDVPLTEAGQRAANQLVGHYDLVICSTLKRARHTLDHSQITYGQIMYSDLCREILSGSMSNLYKGESPHTEAETEIINRAKQFGQILISMISKYPKIAVISHEEFIYRLSVHRLTPLQHIDFGFDQTKQTFLPVPAPVPVPVPVQMPVQTPAQTTVPYGQSSFSFGTQK